MMQRLTKRLASGVADYNLPGNGKSDEVEKSVFRQTCVERLAAYEDTGLDPEQCANAKTIVESAFSDDTSRAERIRELLKADRDGRLVVMPCKVGTATYYIRYPIALYPDESEPEIKRGIFTLPDLDRFGHSVFLTREEAEKALESMKDV